MSGFTKKIRLKEMAEEDIYFARRDRELIEVQHRKKAPRDEAGGEREKDAKSPQNRIRICAANGHGDSRYSENESTNRHIRFPHPDFLPEGEGD